jgi:predicted amidohydrolase
MIIPLRIVKIALAQIQSYPGDVKRNAEKHLAYVEQAAAHQVQALFFPELSLTGYAPTLAHSLAYTSYDAQLGSFQQASDYYKLTIGVGLPLLLDVGLTIGMVIFQPGKDRTVYAKQILHADEIPFFIAGTHQTIITIDTVAIAPAICYESLQPQHAEAAARGGAQLYVATVAKSAAGLARAYEHYPRIARQYNMPVLMVNSVGPCDNFVAAGGSAIWSSQGQLRQQLDKDEGMLFLEDHQSCTK